MSDGSTAFAPRQQQAGAVVASTFQRLLGLVLVAAWASLGAQVRVLIGDQGLLPASELFERARKLGPSPWELPSLFWLGVSDAGLVVGVWLGALLGTLAACGQRPRLCLALSAPLYLSYCVAGDAFLAFQWDNLLIECCVLGACLPAHRASPLGRFAMRVLLFKLYFESGLAKWQSPLSDWHDGSAMTHYFETAPLPTWVGWYAHQLPQGLLMAASWATLVLELIVPWLVFGPRRARRVAFVALTGFQLVNTLTANYGFFTYLSAALHVFLLDDADLTRLGRWLRNPLPDWWGEGAPPARPSPERPRPPHTTALAATVAYLALSAAGAALHFGSGEALQQTAALVYGPVQPLRVVNVYHLFAQITRERIEPELQLRVHGQWRPQHLRYKPGAPSKPPRFVAPHQPRVDFRLWFYGLSFQRGVPGYVHHLLERMCSDPGVVAPLFEAPLPPAPDAARVVFRRYTMTGLDVLSREGMYWQADRVYTLPALPCPPQAAADI